MATESLYPIPCPDLRLTTHNPPSKVQAVHLVAPMIWALCQRVQYQRYQYVTRDARLHRDITSAAGCEVSENLLDEAFDLSLSGVPLIHLEGDQVALTEAGVSAATQIHEHFSPRSNVTAMWIEGQCRKGLIEDLEFRVQNTAELRLESLSGQVRDHIHSFLMVSIRRDAFRSWLLRGDPPKRSQLANWAKRKAINEYRRRGKDALGREMYGARTVSERKSGEDTQDSIHPSVYTLIQHQDEGSDTVEPPTIKDPLTAEILEHSVQGSVGMSRVIDAIRRTKSRNPDRFEDLFLLMVDGYSTEEIGEYFDVSLNRAGNLMASLRQALRQAEQESRNAREIARYLDREPYATLEDIQEDLGVDSPEKLIRTMSRRGHLTDHRGSYTLTGFGRQLLPEPEPGDFPGRLAL